MFWGEWESFYISNTLGITMFTTKVTKKGQITIPVEFRNEFQLGVGSVIELKKVDNGILIERPLKDVMSLKGKWADIPEKIFTDMRRHWGKWNEKSIARY